MRAEEDQTFVIPALVAGIQLSAGTGACGEMDPGDEPRDDNWKRGWRATSSLPLDGGGLRRGRCRTAEAPERRTPSPGSNLPIASDLSHRERLEARATLNLSRPCEAWLRHDGERSARDAMHRAAGEGLWTLSITKLTFASIARLLLSAVAIVHQLQDLRRRFFHRAPRDVDHRPAVLRTNLA